MILYAIRQKSTGFYLPSSKYKKGYTNDVPEPKEVKIPRLFSSHKNAHLALYNWLRGVQVVTYNWEGEFNGCKVKEPKIPRRPEDMEIVEIECSF